MLVVDASVLLELVLDRPAAEPLRSGMLERRDDVHAPSLCDVEVASALRRILRGGLAERARVDAALLDYLDLPLTRHGHPPLLARILELAENFSAYDAAYVALAELLEAPLLTADRRLARAARAHTTLEVLP